jgi:hypothetical protein
MSTVIIFPGGRMKETYCRKIYDTEKSTMLLKTSSGTDQDDPKWFEETLYVTKGGSFFLHGIGGPDSEWGDDEGSKRIAAQGLLPLSRGDALDWIFELDESIDCDDVLDKYFDYDECIWSCRG